MAMLIEAKSRVARGIGPKGGERLTYHFLYVERHAEFQQEASAALSSVRSHRFHDRSKTPGKSVMGREFLSYLA